MPKKPKSTKKPIELPVAEAKAQLGELLHRVSVEGETITITRYGRPVARLVGAKVER